MNGPNFAEIQRKHDTGDLTVEQAQKVGQTHAAYGWASNVPGHWRPELQQAYREGFDEYMRRERVKP